VVSPAVLPHSLGWTGTGTVAATGRSGIGAGTENEARSAALVGVVAIGIVIMNVGVRETDLARSL
jgi:hypothetical protein